MTLHLIKAPPGSHDYQVSHLLPNIHALVSRCYPKWAFFTQEKQEERASRAQKKCVFKGWKQEMKESSAGHKKRLVSNPPA